MSSLVRKGVACCSLILSSCSGGGVSDELGESLAPPPSNQIVEPLKGLQWYLKNSYSEGYDLNIGDIDLAGEGVVVAIVDDGIEFAHEDLATALNNRLHFNYVTNDVSSTDGPHGTSVAGIIGARRNETGILGIASGADLVSYNLIANYSVENEADALRRAISSVSIVNNSWGPTDGTRELSPIPIQSQLAIRDGVTEGRGGLGVIYVWSAGNGGSLDRSSYDGYVNSPYTISVTAVNDAGFVASSSEEGSNHWVSAFGEAVLNDGAILTTDLMGSSGANNGFDPALDSNYRFFDGSSAAAAQVSAVAALMLKARPNLSWRDVKSIIALTAQRNDTAGISWIQNGSPEGLFFSSLYGFGIIDAEKAVTRATTWALLPEQKIITLSNNVDQSIAITQSLKIEYATVEFTQIDWVDISTLDISLTSPAGTNVKLMTPSNCFKPGSTSITECTSVLSGYSFGASAFLNENAYGDWHISIEGDDGMVIDNWELTLYGHDY